MCIRDSEGNILIPNGDTAFSSGDRVVAFASEQGRDFLSHSLQ